MSWADAALDEHVLPKSLTRFRCAWHYRGAPATLLSRATDQAGNVQPTRTALMQGRAPGSIYHCNAIAAWQIDANGEAHHVYV